MTNKKPTWYLKVKCKKCKKYVPQEGRKGLTKK